MATSTFYHTLQMLFMFDFSKTEKQCSRVGKGPGLVSRPIPLLTGYAIWAKSHNLSEPLTPSSAKWTVDRISLPEVSGEIQWDRELYEL